jgi:Protein of unknown function (DUF1549)
MNTDTEPNIIDPFLEELLGGKTPPNLQQAILGRLASIDEKVPAHWGQAAETALRDVQNWNVSGDSFIGNADTIVGDTTSVPGSSLSARIKEAQVATSSRQALGIGNAERDSVDVLTASDSQASQSSSRGRLSSWAVFFVCTSAAILLIVAGFRWIGNRSFDTNPDNDVVLAPIKPEALINSLDSSEQDPANEVGDSGVAIAPKKPRVPQPEALEMDKVPFALSNRSDIAAKSNSPNSVNEPRQKESDLDVVDVIDKQFAVLWNRSEVQIPKSIDSLEWAVRATEFVLGRSPSESELQIANGLKSNTDRIAWLGNLTNTSEFAEHWGKIVAQNWLGRSARNDRDQAFVNWVTAGIRKGTSLAELQRELIVARGTDDQAEADFNPATHWILAASSGGTNQMVDRLGRLLLGQPLMCARCHDDQSSGIARSTYWGVNAVFGQLEFDHEERTRTPFTRVAEGPQKDIFYERDNGTQALAVPLLPDGTQLTVSNSASSIAQLAEWFTNSRSRSAQNVNLVWDSLFGQPLVPLFGLSPEEGATERIHLRDFLTQQFIANDEDLSKAVVWMVASQPFGMPAAPPYSDVALGTDALNSSRLQSKLFASFSANELNDLDSRQARMRMMAEWLQSSNKILSQPAPNQPMRNRDSEALDLANQNFRRIMNTPLPDQIESNIDAWVANKKLNADLLVEHAMLVCDSEQLSDETIALAKDILEQTEGKKQSLTRLIKAYGAGL